MSTRKALAVIAGVVLALGVVLAFVPVSATDDVNCGSALGTGDSGAISDAQLAEYAGSITDAYRGGDGSDDGGYVAQCEDRVTTQRLLAFPLAGIGALGLLFLALTAPKPTQTVSEPAARSDQ